MDDKKSKDFIEIERNIFYKNLQSLNIIKLTNVVKQKGMTLIHHLNLLNIIPFFILKIKKLKISYLNNILFESCDIEVHHDNNGIKGKIISLNFLD